MRQISAPVPTGGHAQARRTSPFAEARRADRELRRVVLRVREWGLGHGRAAGTDALTAVAAAVLQEAREGRRSPLAWTADRVVEVVHRSTPRACARLEMAAPPGLEPAICLLLDYLDAMGVLGAGASVEELTAGLEGRVARRAVRSGRQPGPRHPAGSGRR